MKKRLKSRPIIIDLNGHQPDAGLFYLSLLAPFMLLFVCALQESAWNNAMSVARNLAFLVLLSVLYWQVLKHESNKLTFTAGSIRLPGLGQPHIPFEKIRYVGLQQRKDIMCFGSDDGKWHFVKLRGLSKESAGQLWHLIATRMKHAQVKPEVKDILLNWVSAEKMDGNIHESLLNWTIAEQARQAGEKVTIVPVDPKVSVDLKQFSISGRLEKFISFYVHTCLQVWVGLSALLSGGIILGMVCASLHIPLLQVFAALAHSTEANLLALLFAPADILKEILHFILLEISPLFGNVFGAAIYCSLIVWGALYLARNWVEPDFLELDKLGLTTYKKGAYGAVPQVHLSWQEMEAVELVDRSNKANRSTNRAISFKHKDGEYSLSLNLLGASHRQKLLDALDCYGSSVCIDPKVLKALAPRGAAQEEFSFTELWMDSLSAAPKLNELTPIAAGTVLDCGIVIDRQLASGGQGVTYLAEKDGRRVVLKETFLPFVPAAREAAIKRFDTNAALLKTLSHEQIVSLHDSFIEGHRAFLVMDFAPGLTLKDQIEKNGALTQAQVVDIALQLADILAYLHSRETPVVHRDFTPDNIIVDDGRVKLIDFGTAIKLDDNRSTVVGKQNYLPPEQVAGKTCTASDIYSLGATLFYLLTGSEPEPLSTSRPEQSEIDEEIKDIVAACTSLAPEKRPGADDLRARLNRLKQLQEQKLELNQVENQDQSKGQDQDQILKVPEKTTIKVKNKKRES